MAQIEKSIAIANDAAATSSAKVETAGVLLGASRTAVSKLTDGVSRAFEETTAVIEMINALEASARSIETVVERMVTDASQTTMLAISGSVEAARAGDEGRGFALVATDIRRLARSAGDNGAGAKELVRQMQGQVAAVRRDLEQITLVVQSEVQKNRQIDGRLAEIVGTALDLGRGSAEIAAAAAAGKTTVAQVLAGVDAIAAAAEEANNAAIQAATAAREQAQGAEELAAAIEEIASLASELNKAGPTA